jgi:hypothetical protein
VINTIILFLGTIALVISIVIAGKYALSIRSIEKNDKNIFIQNCGVHTDERKVHHFVASGYIDVTK